MEGLSRFIPETEVEGGSEDGRRLEEEDRGGHGPETSLSKKVKFTLGQATKAQTRSRRTALLLL